MVIGASGGSRISTAVANGMLLLWDTPTNFVHRAAVIRSLTFGDSISTAIEWPRVHHQLVPEVVLYEGM